ncbi:MAG: ABC transporter ATP-binding protein [Oscillospiraceae bacterium]|jgi:ABC-type multidrug transport system ATPase subunit|nr:ABC transporter ATP-binding protein [Oscillospiraceae bacterium]
MKISNIKKEYEKFTLSIKSLEITNSAQNTIVGAESNYPGYVGAASNCPDNGQYKIYGIIGANGCGKTTLMKIMAGIISPSSGTVDYEGLTGRDITMIFRKPYLLHDTVINNLTYPLKIRKIKPNSEEIDILLSMAGLQDLKNEYALTLSGGEQQKLAMIRAFIFKPKLIFVDEGFSNMDIESVNLFEQYIQKMSNTTWVLVSHQMSTIRRVCEYVFFMHKGEITEKGETKKVLDTPYTKELKEYLQYV